MPGIVGLLTTRPKEWAERQLAQMVETLRHESFYVTGVWADTTLGLYVGWVAREKSFSDGMPVFNEQGDAVLVFAGEEYPEPGTAIRLRSRGHQCELDGPSYLIHVYEEDKDFPKNLNGRFQGVVADKANDKVILFNDRFGLQRVYFHESEDTFYFSAEAKAILAVRPELRCLDPQGMGEFVSCGCVLEGRTLFKGIQTLPPASAWEFRGGALKRKTAYFESREWEEQEPLDAEAYYRQLRAAFTDCLPRYFEGSESIGVSLTGGLDTRIIMAWRNAPAGSLPCYTFGSMYRENQDVRLARRVAEICHQPYQLVTVDKECMAKFPHYAERTLYMTDGCVDISRSADLYNNQMARQIAPVRMVGTFGSEIIHGDVMFKHLPPATDLFQPEMSAEIERAGKTYQDQFRGSFTSLVAFRQPAVYHFGVLSLEQTQLTLRSPFLDNGIVKTVFRAPRTQSGEDVRLRLIRDGNAELARLRTDRGVGGPGGLASFINRLYYEFTFKAEYAYDYGMPQWVAKVDHAFAPFHLERLWMGRHKLFHFRWWYRTILADYVQEILLDSRALARPYVKRSTVETIVRAHLKGDRNYTTELHRLLSLELLHRLFIDAAC